MLKKHLELEELSILLVRKPIKNMHLRVYPPDGRVQISAPLHVNIDYIRQLIVSKRKWIDTQRQKMSLHHVPQSQSYDAGSKHLIQGQLYTLVFHQDQQEKIRLDDHNLQVYLPTNLSTHTCQQLLTNWYRQQLQSQLQILLAKWQPIIGVNSSDIVIKAMKTRWGSCNIRSKRITMNLTLIHKSPICLEYVLVHELIHLLEASHNQRFYKLMDQFLPNWRSYKQELADNRLTTDID